MKESELILNPDGSIYHLALQKGEIANTIILVGDQDRVPLVSRHFDKIEIKKQKREFFTHTGWLNNKRISVLSTGIGTDNIDIVVNELDALVNINFQSRQVLTNLTSLNLIRIGTSGGIHPDINLSDIVVSKYAVGTDALGQFYELHKKMDDRLPDWSYLTKRYDFNLESFPSRIVEGGTLTCAGFYHPQGRKLRIATGYELSIEEISSIRIDGLNIVNMEMETAGIYLLAGLLGHKAISFNSILAKRSSGEFIENPGKSVHELIEHVLSWISSTPSME
jgi:uridine phosphorylase